MKQIKIWDDCTYAIEPIRLDLMQVKNTVFQDINASYAIDVCKQSLQHYPNDAHVKFLLARAYTKAKQYNKGYSLASEACNKGDIGGCNLLAVYHEFALMPQTHNTKKKMLLFLWSCVQGNSQACANLYNKAQWNTDYLPEEMQSDPAQIKAHKLNLCLRGDFPEVCHDYAKDLFKNRAFTTQTDEFEFTASRSCISGDAEGCLFYQSFLDKHPTDTKRQQRSTYVYKKSCNNGNTESCLKIARMYASKKRTSINNITALALYENACVKGKNVDGCYAAGSYYLAKLDGIIQNIPRGIKYLEQSCTVRYTSKESINSSSGTADISLYGCYALAQYLLNPPDTRYKDETKAKRFLHDTCQFRQYYYTDALGCKLGIHTCCNNTKR